MTSTVSYSSITSMVGVFMLRLIVQSISYQGIEGSWLSKIGKDFNTESEQR